MATVYYSLVRTQDYLLEELEIWQQKEQPRTGKIRMYIPFEKKINVNKLW